jgi:hypothetical protein
MALRNVWAWFDAKGGPREGGLVKSDGAVVHFRYDDRRGREVANANIGTAVAFVARVPYSGRWVAEGDHPAGGTLHSAEQETPEAAAADFLRLRGAIVAEEERIAANPAEHLAREVSRHDWHAHYSDDGRVWARAEAHWQQIEEIMRKLDPEVAEAIVKKHRPE